MNYTIVNFTPKEDIKNILDMIKNKSISNLMVLGSGESAIVYKYKNYAIKIASGDYYQDEGISDGEILEQLQDIEIFPKLYFYTDYFMVVEYLDIIPSYSYFDRNVNIELTAWDIFNKCFEKGFIPFDLHDDNVIVTRYKEELKIIDVGNFIKVRNKKSLDDYLLEQASEYSELENIIEHVKCPPIII